MKATVRIATDRENIKALVDEWLDRDGDIVISVGDKAFTARITYVKEID